MKLKTFVAIENYHYDPKGFIHTFEWNVDYKCYSGTGAFWDGRKSLDGLEVHLEDGTEVKNNVLFYAIKSAVKALLNMRKQNDAINGLTFEHKYELEL